MNKNKTELEGVQPSAQNDIAQAPPAQENNETSPAPAGGCLPRPCSAPIEFALVQSKKSGQELLSAVKHLNELLLPSQTPTAAHP